MLLKRNAAHELIMKIVLCRTHWNRGFTALERWIRGFFMVFRLARRTRIVMGAASMSYPVTRQTGPSGAGGGVGAGNELLLLPIR